MRAVLTGASGLLGSNLAIELHRQGVQVRCTRRRGSRVDHLSEFPLEWVEADLADPESLARAFAGADVVFHCAALVVMAPKPTAEMISTNVDGTRHVLHAVRRAGALRLVHCSSTVATGLSMDGTEVTEECPWNLERFGLADGYSITKRQSEELVRQSVDEVDAVIVNPGFMLGPYDPRPSSGKLIVSLVRGNVPGTTPGYNNFVDVRDVARGMIAAWHKGRRGERYILGNANMSYAELMTLVAKVAGVKPPRFSVPQPLAQALGWLGDLQERITGKEALVNSVSVRWSFCTSYICSSEKARRELGYNPGPLETAIADAVAWFRERQML